MSPPSHLVRRKGMSVFGRRLRPAHRRRRYGGSSKAEPPAHPRARGGWLIQVGTFEGEDEARQHLIQAQLKAKTVLASAEPFTERVQKGDKALYRARLAGFDKDQAEAACKKLQRSDIVCMALKN